MRYAVVLLLLMASPALAFDHQYDRAALWAEVRQARAEAKLCQPEIIALVEAQRARANESALNQFGRVSPASSSVTPTPTPAPTPPSAPIPPTE